VVALNKLRLTRETIAAAPDLKLIVLAATGTNNVDSSARERGIGVCNVRDYCTASVVQHVLGTLLLLTQRLREYDVLVRSAPGHAATSSACSTSDPGTRGAQARHRGSRRARQGGGAAANIALGMEVWVANRPGGEPHAAGTISTTCCQRWTCSACTVADAADAGLVGTRELARMKPMRC